MAQNSILYNIEKSKGGANSGGSTALWIKDRAPSSLKLLLLNSKMIVNKKKRGGSRPPRMNRPTNEVKYTSEFGSELASNYLITKI